MVRRARRLPRGGLARPTPSLRGTDPPTRRIGLCDGALASAIPPRTGPLFRTHSAPRARLDRRRAGSGSLHGADLESDPPLPASCRHFHVWVAIASQESVPNAVGAAVPACALRRHALGCMLL